MKNFILWIAALLFFFQCGSTTNSTSNPITGVWEITRITRITAEGRFVNDHPQPGLFIFAGTHYSMAWTPTGEMRKSSQKTWFPTDAEKLNCFNSIIVNSGTFTVTDSILTTVPLVAKTPEFVGGTATYQYHVTGDTLQMTIQDIHSADGVQDPGIGYYTTQLKLKRLE
jgi:hypothetical protein